MLFFEKISVVGRANWCQPSSWALDLITRNYLLRFNIQPVSGTILVVHNHC